MFIVETSSDYDEENNITYYNYTIADNEFGTETYRLTNNYAADMRIIISEYSKRKLNVATNLKRYLSWKFGMYSRNRYRWEAKDVMRDLEDDRRTLNIDYPHMHFDQYYDCLMRHINRMKFAGVIK